MTDLLAAELGRMRPGRPPPPAPWAPVVEFVRDLGTDSLELMGLGTALVEALHLDSGIDDRLLARPCLADWVESARAALDASDLALTFRTSGSSGDPKRCTHALATLAQEADALVALVQGRRRVLSAVSSHHIYGFLFTVLLPQRLGGGVDVIDVRQAAPSALAGLVRAGDLVVAHPLWWEAAARCAPAFAADVAGVTSTAPCPDALADALAAAGLRLLQVYGSSETAGVGWRDRADTPFALLPHWTRADEPNALLRTLPDGSTRSYPLQDRLDWMDGRHFLPAGRIDAAVQVGGTNVFPAYVADVLAQHPHVREAAVRLMRPDEGRRLKAYVAARPDADLDALRAELPAWAAQRLAPAERPAAWTFGPRLPRQASGKLADWIIDAEP
ncbi:AMP-binding protein [Massilia pinisoli]|uniref:AMP-binding protein n=1 Tax=Massilia pinisoli TaxID=1772194 RepID=A0ABT1ZWI0_9BURK|nr:AMP-binding protein [Massilia pinisoli]